MILLKKGFIDSICEILISISENYSLLSSLFCLTDQYFSPDWLSFKKCIIDAEGSTQYCQ